MSRAAIFLGLQGLIVLVGAYMLVRNAWVLHVRLRLLHTDQEAYGRLPEYGYMLYRRWWVWNINKFVR